MPPPTPPGNRLPGTTRNLLRRNPIRPVSYTHLDVYKRQIQSQLKMYRAYINAETADLQPPASPALSGMHATETAGRTDEHLTFIYQKLLHMSDPEKKMHYRKTCLLYTSGI